jgi:hypothetical protein
MKSKHNFFVNTLLLLGFVTALTGTATGLSGFAAEVKGESDLWPTLVAFGLDAVAVLLVLASLWLDRVYVKREQQKNNN